MGASGTLEFRSRKRPAEAPAAKHGATERSEQAATAVDRRQRPHGEVPQAQQRHVGDQGIAFMVTDVTEEAHGCFHLWGVDGAGGSVLVRVSDFRPYFYIAAPKKQMDASDTTNLSDADLDKIQQLLNRTVPPDSRVVALSRVDKIPIMYYRPRAAGSIPALQVTLTAGGSLRKASAAVAKVLASETLASLGFIVTDAELYEHEVAMLQRFLVDASVSGGAWLYVPCNSPNLGFQQVPQQSRISSCGLEVTAPYTALYCLTPDATQLADEHWNLQPPDNLSGPAAELWNSTAKQAREGVLAPMKLMVLDVVTSTRDGKDRVPVPTGRDPIVAITCIMSPGADSAAAGATSTQQPLQSLGALSADDGLDDNDEVEQDTSDGAAVPEIAGGVGSKQDQLNGAMDKVAFVLAEGCTAATLQDRGHGFTVHRMASERAMLVEWLAYFCRWDPDALVLFEVKDTLGPLQERFKALNIGGGGLALSRLQGMHSKALTLKKITQYSAAWVRSQSRMSATSNQETYRANIEGRVVFDLLRQILTNCNLASYSLVDAVQSLLGRRLEVVPPSITSALAGLVPPPPSLTILPYDSEAGPSRLATYAGMRVHAVRDLLLRMAIVPESIELARATGLTLADVLYRAQMIRTWSLLLRNAQRLGYVISGRVDPQQLVESPFLMHPVEAGTVGHYRTPVCILDFASLYPSLYRAHNLCYTTLLHPDDAASVAADDVTTTPTGDKFVKPSLREGVLPKILSALIQARAASRAALKETTDPSRRSVLDSRQKALKLVANALYGFTGAQTSMLQCLPLADSCLAMGAASTQRAVHLLHNLAESGDLGDKGKTARVIYGQTDSIFISVPEATTLEALRIGQQAAKLITAAFPPAMELKFEKVANPFLLLHVNRYAGRAFEKEEEVAAGEGTLMVKGMKSAWRMAPPILRSTLQGALRRLILRDDLPGAVAWVEKEVARLLKGDCELWELVMTGGLWRVSGQQISAAAEGVGEEEMRGPHASLAARLVARDPGRHFLLGQRLQYVLLPGARLQDDASEDPLTAAKAGAVGDVELYWKNKLLRPLQELFATCLPHAQLQALLTGPHAQKRPDPQFAGAQAQLANSKGGKQTALNKFFSNKLRCLGCKRTVEAAADGCAPPFCDTCQADPDKAALVWAQLTADANKSRERQRLACSTCIACHSGGPTGPIVCENGECPVLFSRLGATRRLDTVLKAKARIDDW